MKIWNLLTVFVKIKTVEAYTISLEIKYVLIILKGSRFGKNCIYPS